MVLGSSTHFAGWILAVAAAALTGCSQPRTAEERASPPELRLEGVRFRLFRGEALRADGTASSLTYQRGSTAVKGTGIQLQMHEQRELVTLSAPSGSGVLSARTFDVGGGLVAVRGTDTAKTDAARFEPGLGTQGRVVGDQPVELSGKGYRMRGSGFSLDPAAGEIAIRGGTRLVAGLGGSR